MLMGTALLLGSCGTLNFSTPVTSYVALGDSITAGYQSTSLTAEGQRSSYAVLFGQRAGVTAHSPEGKGPGCPPPPGKTATADSCVRANPDAVVTNFAVPGAKVADLLNSSVATFQGKSASAAALYNLILGPQDTQVTAAVKAKAQFLTVWIGANDVLAATLAGTPSGATPPATFENDYRKLLDGLKPSGTIIVPFTVPDVTSVPLLVPAALAFKLGLGDASCENSVNKVNLGVAQQLKPMSCADDAPGVLSPAELKTATDTVEAYNSSIRKLAAERGLRVFDVNPTLHALNGAYDPTAPQTPFGPNFSLDGVHPSSSAHAKFAVTLAQFFNSTFGTRVRVN
ncbi:lipolytic protein G-D-S-L family [Deinococcus maricopensis DSM 21211]|uniref:Lipolytic protein G-D-S-L family n=2 Tax=Deinococcus TaxID=1298 RepID=E8U6P7_DEIML|nr:lipolytic protein G-D-S-L family [Deinococcus maricopensis DSM 21211]